MFKSYLNYRPKMCCNIQSAKYKSLHLHASYLLSSVLHLKCYAGGFFIFLFILLSWQHCVSLRKETRSWWHEMYYVYNILLLEKYYISAWHVCLTDSFEIRTKCCPETVFSYNHYFRENVRCFLSIKNLKHFSEDYQTWCCMGCSYNAF